MTGSGRFNPTVPARRQKDRWACCPSALGWALESLGLDVSHDFIVQGMVDLRYLTRVDGIGMRDKTGIDLMEYVNRDFAFMGISATAHPHVGWSAITAEAGRCPLVLYGEKWQHWTAVRGISLPSGVLSLANSADPLRRAPRQVLTYEDWCELGPFHMVAVRRN